MWRSGNVNTDRVWRLVDFKDRRRWSITCYSHVYDRWIHVAAVPLYIECERRVVLWLPNTNVPRPNSLYQSLAIFLVAIVMCSIQYFPEYIWYIMVIIWNDSQWMVLFHTCLTGIMLQADICCKRCQGNTILCILLETWVKNWNSCSNAWMLIVFEEHRSTRQLWSQINMTLSL